MFAAKQSKVAPKTCPRCGRLNRSEWFGARCRNVAACDRRANRQAEEKRAAAKACPNCGAGMELVKASEGGRIEEPYFPAYPLRGQPLPRRSRPASFWACSGCEHCEEVR